MSHFPHPLNILHKVRVSSLESGAAPIGIGVAWASGEHKSTLVTREPDLGGTLLYMQSQEKSTLYSREDYGEYTDSGLEKLLNEVKQKCCRTLRSLKFVKKCIDIYFL